MIPGLWPEQPGDELPLAEMGGPWRSSHSSPVELIQHRSPGAKRNTGCALQGREVPENLEKAGVAAAWG